jgi:K+-transporting ATPase ATPase A chain
MTAMGVMLFFLIALTLFVKSLGTYMTNVFQDKRTLLSPILIPIENLIYKAAGVNLRSPWRTTTNDRCKIIE